MRNYLLNPTDLLGQDSPQSNSTGINIQNELLVKLGEAQNRCRGESMFEGGEGFFALLAPASVFSFLC